MPSSIPLVRLAHVAPFAGELRRIGAPVERRLRAARLPSLALGGPAAMASAHLIYDFVETSWRAEGFTDLGWRAGAGTRPEQIGALGQSFLAGSPCVSLHDALARSFARAREESRQIHLWMKRHGEWVDLRYMPSLDADVPGFLMAEQYMLGLLTALVRSVLGAAWRPQALFLRSPAPTGLESAPDLDGVPIHGSAPGTAVRVPVAMLEVAMRVASATGGPSDGGATAALGTQPATFVDSLLDGLAPYLPDGGPTVELAANLANTSVRTLQRQLGDAGTSFSRLLDEVRLRSATRLLRETDVGLAEIAERVGYSDPPHFTRAFRRWTGVTPSAYRGRGRR